MWGPIMGGAGILAFILGIIAFYNGRATRKLILDEERRTQEILKRQEKLLEKLSEQHSAMMEMLRIAQSKAS